MNGAGCQRPRHGSLLQEGLNEFGRHQGEGAWGPMIGGKTSPGVKPLDSSKPGLASVSQSCIHSANISASTGSQSMMQLSSPPGEDQSSGETDTKLDEHVSV